MKRLSVSIALAVIVLAETGCRRAFDLASLQSLLRPPGDSPTPAVAAPSGAPPAMSEIPGLHVKSPPAPSRAGTHPKPARVRDEGYVVDPRSGQIYLQMALSSGAPVFLQVNGKRVVHTTVPLSDSTFRLSSQIVLHGRTHYTYREVR